MWTKLLQPEYLLEPRPGQPGPFRILYLLLAAAALSSLVLTMVLQRRPRGLKRWTLAVETLLVTAALLLIGCSFMGVPYFSMRLLVFGANLAALAFPIAAAILHFEPVNLCDRLRSACTGQMDVNQPLLPWGSQLLLSSVHLLGLLMLTLHYCWELVVLLPGALLGPQWVHSLRERRWRIHLEGLTPLFLVYAVLLARVAVLTAAKFLGYPHFILPADWNAWLDVRMPLCVALSWSFAAQMYAVLRTQQRERALVAGFALALLLASFGWAAYTYVHQRTHGVTGSDPYCYAQMGVDVALHGLPVHYFPLAKRMAQLKIWPEAAVHLGYHVPFDASGRAATVWPVGQALFLALGFRLAGEQGLYLTTPVLGLLSLLALAALGWELWSHRPRSERLLACAIAVFLLATSFTQVDRLVVPMADAAAQLLTTLTVLLAFKAVRSTSTCDRVPAFSAETAQSNPATSARSALWAFGAGLAFGAAYLVRHTQLVLVASVLLLVWCSSAAKRHKAALLVCFAAGALTFGVPDLLYHQWVMGNWWRPESLELRHFALSFMLPMAWRALRELFAAQEFLFVIPFILYGVLRQWREERAHLAVLSTWAGTILLIHLPYEALRLRDLLSLFPVLCLWAGYGVAGLWKPIQKHLVKPGADAFLPAFTYAWLVAVLLLLRTGSTLGLANQRDFNAFGYLNAAQRAALTRIERDTEETAAIGASLNSGALELHSHRIAFRPAIMRSEDFYVFVDDALMRGTPIYLLEDGQEMQGPLQAARERYDLHFVAAYDLPYYYPGGGSVRALVDLYRVRPR